MRADHRPFAWIVSFLLLCVLLELADPVVPGGLDRFGIVPRHPIGLRGIVAAPVLHGSWEHLAVNALPFAILGTLVALADRRAFLGASAFIVGVGGAGVWLFARTALHLGASGLISGFLGYLIARGFYERSIKSAAIGILTVWMYGGLLWGLLPSQPGVSWESHLFGFLAGILAARLWTPRGRRSRR